MTQDQKDKAKTKREFNIVMTRQFHTLLQCFSGLLIPLIVIGIHLKINIVMTRKFHTLLQCFSGLLPSNCNWHSPYCSCSMWAVHCLGCSS